MEKIIQIVTMPAGYVDDKSVIPWVYGLGEDGTLYRLVENDGNLPKWEVYVTKENNE